MDADKIIDIEPIEASSAQTTDYATYEVPGDNTSTSEHTGTGTYTHSSYSQQTQPPRAYKVRVETREIPYKKPSRLVGLLLMAIGAVVMIIGISLLILPGPGILTICAGGALVVAGFRRLFGIRSSRSSNIRNDFNTNVV